MAEAIEDIDYNTPKDEHNESDNENKTPEEINTEKVVEEPKPEVKIRQQPEEVKVEDNFYPDLKKITLNPYSDSIFDICLPSSLILCKKRRIETSEMDRPKLLHELAKVIKTLDYIETHNKDCEVELVKELGKEGFKWDKSTLVESWATAMQQKHDNLLKGSMIVHDYLNQLITAVFAKVDQLKSTGVDKNNLKEQLNELKEMLNKKTLLPIVLTTPMDTEIVSPKPQKPPKEPKEEKAKKSLVKRIKKVF